MAEPFVLTPTPENPYPAVKAPNGDLWVWTPSVNDLVNISREPPVSPDQVLKNFQVGHARYEASVFKQGKLIIKFAAATVRDVARGIASFLAVQLAAEGNQTGLQYACYDLVDQVWIDPSTGRELLPDWSKISLMNAELRINGGFDNLIQW